MAHLFTTKHTDILGGPYGNPYEYSDLAALAAAEHAVGVYADPEHYGAEVTRAGFDGGMVHHAGPTQVGMAWSPEVIVIAARGSDEGLDWLGNLMSVFRVGWKGVLPRGARAGWGFVRHAKRIAPMLADSLLSSRMLYPDAKIVVCGHSLGAAMVPLIVARLMRQGVSTRSSWMFEPPRAGNQKFKHWYDTKGAWGSPSPDGFRLLSVESSIGRAIPSTPPTYMVVNVIGGESDLVTRVPLRRHGARHVGQRVIHADGKVFRGEDAWQLHRAANPVSYWQALRFVTRTLRAIRAHLGSNLLATLRARV